MIVTEITSGITPEITPGIPAEMSSATHLGNSLEMPSVIYPVNPSLTPSAIYLGNHSEIPVSLSAETPHRITPRKSPQGFL